MIPRITLLAALVVAASCHADSPSIDSDSHEAEVVEWREGRLERLKAPTGYLNLAGLFWLQDGRATFGSAPTNDIVFPDSAPALMGYLDVSEAGVVMHVANDVMVVANGQPVVQVFMADDTTEAPVTASFGSMAWVIVKRAGRYALRLRDFEHPAIDAFPPLEYFPIDADFRVTATFKPFDEPRIANVGTVIEGLGYHPEVPGTVTFEIDGETQNLEGYAVGDELFLVFGDATSGRETYPAGRFLYVHWPKGGGETVLDFNKSYNPPCAFNDFSTCPVASPRNRMRTRIEAGELYDPDVHFTPESYH
ncbi:MAG: DUF1684 domain-containing protein [Pseudomonadota bacterium]